MVHNIILEETKNFFQKIMESEIKVIFLEYTKDTIYETKQWNECNTLAICAWDYEIEYLKETKIGVIAYQNPTFERQLFQEVLMIVEGFDELDYSFMEKMFQRRHNLPWKIFETQRTYVREMTLKDLPKLFDLYNKEGMTRFVEPLKEWEEEVEYTKSYIKYQYGYFGYGMWLVYLKDTNQLIGRAGLDNHEYKDEVLLEMGYMIDPDFHKKGFATEICLGIIEYAKKNLDFEKIYCFIQQENKASLSVVKKLKFKKANNMPITQEGMISYEINL